MGGSDKVRDMESDVKHDHSHSYMYCTDHYR